MRTPNDSAPPIAGRVWLYVGIVTTAIGGAGMGLQAPGGSVIGVVIAGAIIGAGGTGVLHGHEKIAEYYRNGSHAAARGRHIDEGPLT